MKITLHPDAEQDIQDAAEFYEREGSPVLAARFVAEFKRLLNLLIEQPGIGSPRAKGKRGFSMSVFPYTVIYAPVPKRSRSWSSSTTESVRVMAAHVRNQANSTGATSS